MVMTSEEKASALAQLPLFAGISDESMGRLAAVAGEQQFPAGHFIVLQGQVGSGVYIIVEGSVRVIRGDDELATLGPGEFFGELAVIDQKPRSASVQTTQPTRVVAIASWDLLALLESDSALALNMIKGLVERVRVAGEQHHH